MIETDNRGAGLDAVYPRSFSLVMPAAANDAYLRDASIEKLLQFFETKGMAALKEEDRCEQWYDDWLQYQARHRLYASVLSPKQYSSLGYEFDLLKLARFLEVFGYCSPAHGYSLQVSFLGLFPILMGAREALKREAVATLEAGGLFALGVSERRHGADLLGNEFSVKEVGGRWVASGSKCYIGNSNCASIMSILARKEDDRTAGRERRAPFVLFALRPSQSPRYRNVRKIRTLGIRQAFVGELEVNGHELPPDDVFAEGRRSWDAVLGTVTLGKFFLGFGSIGICEHAITEAAAHLSQRVLYGKPAIQMPHLRTAMSQAYARLCAMKLYAFRALDYVHAARRDDRRYLLYCAVQKAKVSTEGVKTMALLSQCVGAKGFESDTYFEMALRDAQLIPDLEGSRHINLGQAAQFISRYFAKPHPAVEAPQSLLAGQAIPGENPYLMEARTGAVSSIAFAEPLAAYRPLASIPNVRRFAKQVKAMGLFVRRGFAHDALTDDPEGSLLIGQCLATIAYGQLIAEHAASLAVAPEMISAIFELLVTDLSTAALALATNPLTDEAGRAAITRLLVVPKTAAADWDVVAGGLAELAS